MYRAGRNEMHFNPRSHERSDSSLLSRNSFTNFNPRSHERSDDYVAELLIKLHQFQSTLPREERHLIVFIADAFLYFNPRSHERSDLLEPLTGSAHSISIHAPTRGATDFVRVLYHVQLISIHAPTRGATAILHKKFVYFYTIPTINI